MKQTEEGKKMERIQFETFFFIHEIVNLFFWLLFHVVVAGAVQLLTLFCFQILVQFAADNDSANKSEKWYQFKNENGMERK